VPAAARPPRGVILTVAVAVGVIAVAALAGYLAWVRPHQARVRQADAHARTLNLAIGQDPRFARVVVVNGSDGGGVLTVFGEVGTASDLAALGRVVAASRPPVAVEWHTHVRGVPAVGPATGPATARLSR
jgi:hypothetical protein